MLCRMGAISLISEKAFNKIISSSSMFQKEVRGNVVLVLLVVFVLFCLFIGTQVRL